MQLCSPAPFGLNNAQECNSNKHLTQSRHAGNRSSRPKSCRPKLSPNASGILIPESRKIYSCGIRNLEKNCWWNPESWALKFRIKLWESGIPLVFGMQKPRSGIQYLKSGLHGLESRIQFCLGFPCMGRKLVHCVRHQSRGRLTSWLTHRRQEVIVNGQKSKSVEVLSLFAVNRFRKKTLRFIVGSRQPKLSIRV